MSFDKNYIESRIARSKETMDEAKLMFENKHYLTVSNRLYYAVFYLVCAYLGKAKIVTKTHSGTKNQFHLNFIKTGILDENFGIIYDTLFQERNDNDYGDFAILEKEDVEELLNETEELLKIYWTKFEQENN